METWAQGLSLAGKGVLGAAVALVAALWIGAEAGRERELYRQDLERQLADAATYPARAGNSTDLLEPDPLAPAPPAAVGAPSPGARLPEVGERVCVTGVNTFATAAAEALDIRQLTSSKRAAEQVARISRIAVEAQWAQERAGRAPALPKRLGSVTASADGLGSGGLVLGPYRILRGANGEAEVYHQGHRLRVDRVGLPIDPEPLDCERQGFAEFTLPVDPGSP